METSSKVKAVKILLKGLEWKTAINDCDKDNYERYADWILKDRYNNVCKVDITGKDRRIYIDKELFEFTMDLEALLISSKVIENKGNERAIATHHTVERLQEKGCYLYQAETLNDILEINIFN